MDEVISKTGDKSTEELNGEEPQSVMSQLCLIVGHYLVEDQTSGYDMDNGVLMNKSMEKVVLTCKTEVSVCPSVIVTVGT